MNKIILLLAILLSGCASLSERQRQILKIGGATLITGAIIAHNHNSPSDGHINTPRVDCAYPEQCR